MNGDFDEDEDPDFEPEWESFDDEERKDQSLTLGFLPPMTADARCHALLADIAARLEREIAEQHLKRSGIMRNGNTLRRVLKGEQDYQLSTLVDAAAGANCEVEITITRKP